jgi:hypothetical protein
MIGFISKFFNVPLNMIQSSLGNLELLKLPKTAFLCSRKIPAAAVLPSYDWAITQRELGKCYWWFS